MSISFQSKRYMNKAVTEHQVMLVVQTSPQRNVRKSVHVVCQSMKRVSVPCTDYPGGPWLIGYRPLVRFAHESMP